MIDAARRARVVIAEISDRVPWTCGAELPEDIVPDVIVRTSREPISLGSSAPTEDDLKLARNVAEFIPDAATIEIGIGTIPDLVLEALSGHKNLALHSGVIGDVAVELIKKGVIDNSLKPFDQGVSIAGFLLGTRKLFDYAHENPSIRLAPTSHTHDIRVLSRLQNFYAVNAALEVDLTGQVNAEVIGNRYLGAVGGQVDFSRGANLSEGGRAIIAVSSTARGGSVSRIVNRIESGIVTTPRVDVDIIVSEWGSAELRGTTLKQRAERLCAIAHPKFREGLEREAHKMFQTL
nr:acetyl-CoA hydrolase/transferase C-terminal domain-containing protein [Sneathiella chungangensis]